MKLTMTFFLAAGLLILGKWPLLVQATESAKVRHPVNVARDLLGGRIVAQPALDFYPDGTRVTFKAVADPHYEFVSWEGDLAGKKKRVEKLTIQKSLTVGARFRRSEVSLLLHQRGFGLLQLEGVTSLPRVLRFFPVGKALKITVIEDGVHSFLGFKDVQAQPLPLQLVAEESRRRTYELLLTKDLDVFVFFSEPKK